MRRWTLPNEVGILQRDLCNELTVTKKGKLHLEPTVVGLSKFNESVQKLKNGQVAG